MKPSLRPDPRGDAIALELAASRLVQLCYQNRRRVELTGERWALLDELLAEHLEAVKKAAK